MRWKIQDLNNHPKTKWHRWFAWFPILIDDTCYWLEYIERKRIYGIVWGGYSTNKKGSLSGNFQRILVSDYSYVYRTSNHVENKNTKNDKKCDRTPNNINGFLV